MVWRKKSDWVIETEDGRYRIEKFAVAGSFRYRILKILSEWYFELAPSETAPDTAKQICQENLNESHRVVSVPVAQGTP